MNREFKDQIPPEGGRKYRITENPDGTSGISDVTEYQQEGTPFGAKEAMELYDGIVPPGAVIPYAGSSAPDGWLLCDGRTLQSDRYPELYAAIGTTYGQNKPGSFKLPDMRGRVAAGANASNALASRAGADSKQIARANLPAEKLNLEDDGIWIVDSVQTGSESGKTLQMGTRSGAARLETNTLGSGTAFDVRQATLYLNYIIKY